jgi:hypothetical protein
LRFPGLKAKRLVSTQPNLARFQWRSNNESVHRPLSWTARIRQERFADWTRTSLPKATQRNGRFHAAVAMWPARLELVHGPKIGTGIRSLLSSSGFMSTAPSLQSNFLILALRSSLLTSPPSSITPRRHPRAVPVQSRAIQISPLCGCVVTDAGRCIFTLSMRYRQSSCRVRPCRVRPSFRRSWLLLFSFFKP